MSFKFASQKLLNGLFEPEGIYLAPPFEGELAMIQGFGACPEFYGQWRYNGVPLKGHTGIDVLITPGARLYAMDAGKVVEIGVERGGFERYIKLEHRWGESFYANAGDALVETGQAVGRGAPLATAPQPDPTTPPTTRRPARVLFHFAIRVLPYNRYDGFGGFADPLPYLPPGSVFVTDDAGGDVDAQDNRDALPPHPMMDDSPGLRRP